MAAINGDDRITRVQGDVVLGVPLTRVEKDFRSFLVPGQQR
jgi:hypothetical protein